MAHIKELCRICGSNFDLIEINFKADSEKLLTCANIKFNLFDKLPKYLCRKCKKSLDLSYELRKQSEATEERLKLKIGLDCSGEKLKEETNDERKALIDMIGELEDFDEEEEFIPITRKSPISIFNAHNQNSDVECVNNNANLIEINADDSEDICIKNIPMVALNNNSLSKTSTATEQENESLVEPEEIDLITDSESESQSSRDQNYHDRNNSNDTSLSNVNSTNNDGTINNMSQQIAVSVLNTSNETDFRVYTVDAPQNNVKYLFECKMCNKAFTSRCSVTRHVNSSHHELPKKYKCTKCDRGYNRHYNLAVHMKKMHDAPGHLCPLCLNKFQTMTIFKEHILKHCKDGTSTFSKSPHTFERWQVHGDHNRSSKTRSPVTTSLTVATPSLAIPAVVSTTAEATVIPSTSLSLLSNSQNNSVLQLYHCAYCGYLSNTFTMHENHLKLHRNVKQNICGICGMKFPTITSLKKHKYNCHNFKNKMYTCDICTCQFHDINAFEKHKLEHQNVAANVCTICFTNFVKEDELEIHMQKQHNINCNDSLQQQQQRVENSIENLRDNKHNIKHRQPFSDALSSDIQSDMIMENDERELVAESNEIKLFDTINKATIVDNNLKSITIDSDSDSDSENDTCATVEKEYSLVQMPKTMQQMCDTIVLDDDDDDSDNNDNKDFNTNIITNNNDIAAGMFHKNSLNTAGLMNSSNSTTIIDITK